MHYAINSRSRFTGSSSHPQPAGRGFRPGSASAFTLVELLVAMTVLAVMLVMTAQMVNQTMGVTTSLNRRMDTASMARIALDRFGFDFSAAILSNGASALYYTPMAGSIPDPAANSSIGFIAQSRGRWTSVVTVNSDIRGVIVGYKIRNQDFAWSSDPTSPGVPVPVLQRGDGRFTYSLTDCSNNSNKSAYEVDAILGSKNAGGQTVKRIPDDIVEMFPHPATTKDDSDGTILNYTGLGDGVMRLHISFVLDDGRTVQVLKQGTTLNATYQNFIAYGGTGVTQPIAFSASTSADPNKRFVRGLIVGVVVLDEATMRLAWQVDKSFASKLATQLGRPTKDGETPVGVWQQNLKNVTFLPVRQNIRFYQRFYSVNL